MTVSALMIEAASTSETSVKVYQIHVVIFQKTSSHLRHENLKSHQQGMCLRRKCLGLKVFSRGSSDIVRNSKVWYLVEGHCEVYMSFVSRIIVPISRVTGSRLLIPYSRRLVQVPSCLTGRRRQIFQAMHTFPNLLLYCIYAVLCCVDFKEWTEDVVLNFIDE